MVLMCGVIQGALLKESGKTANCKCGIRQWTRGDATKSRLRNGKRETDCLSVGSVNNKHFLVQLMSQYGKPEWVGTFASMGMPTHENSKGLVVGDFQLRRFSRQLSINVQVSLSSLGDSTQLVRGGQLLGRSKGLGTVRFRQFEGLDLPELKHRVKVNRGEIRCAGGKDDALILFHRSVQVAALESVMEPQLKTSVQ